MSRAAYNRQVLRSRALDATLSRLALLAVLLLVFAPSISRVLASGTPQVLAGWSELCTTMGLKTLPSEARSSAGAPAPSPGMPAGAEYCDYCPLAASLPLLLLALVLLPPVLRRQGPFLPVASRLRTLDHLRGLGCRGPPVLL